MMSIVEDTPTLNLVNWRKYNIEQREKAITKLGVINGELQQVVRHLETLTHEINEIDDEITKREDKG